MATMDWGMKDRMARIIRPSTGRAVMLAVDPSMVRNDKLAPSQDFQTSGVMGDPRKASVEYGNKGLEIQIEGAVAQITELTR